jgi:hypothetical protein
MPSWMVRMTVSIAAFRDGNAQTAEEMASGRG